MAVNLLLYAAKKESGWEKEYYLRDFFCDSYFMWSLSEAMQDNEVSWSNCWKYCSFAIDDIESGLLPSRVKNKNAPLVDLNDYETAFRVLRVFSGLFSGEATTEETLLDIKWLDSKLKTVNHSVIALQDFIEKCNAFGLDKMAAEWVWQSVLRPKILSDKSGIDI